MRTFEDLAVKVNGSFKPRRVIGTFTNASVGRKIEAASLRQLLKLVLVHFPISREYNQWIGLGDSPVTVMPEIVTGG